MPQGLIKKCRKLLEEKNIDYFVVPTADFHNSEFVGDYFKLRQFISGFTGSAGVLLIAKEEALLWTDGRYFLQAEKELQGTGIRLMKSGNPGVPEIDDYLAEKMPEGGVLAFDGRTVTAFQAARWKEKLAGKNVTFRTAIDLADSVWKDRPQLPRGKMYLLPEEYSGKSYKEKMEGLLSEMKRNKVTVFVESSLDNIAWLLNIRGSDIRSNPVFLSYLVITEKDTILYVDGGKLGPGLTNYLNASHIVCKEYFDIYEDVYRISGERVWVDVKNLNSELYGALKQQNTLCEKRNPLAAAKACKNETEIEGLRRAHLFDGIAVTRFIYQLKRDIGTVPMTELSVTENLLRLRKKEESFIETSFDTIAAYKENAAMLHYSAGKRSNAELKAEGMLLVDSGGQYLFGTTDVTRTIVLGEVTQEEKICYTLTLKGMLRLANQCFPEGCCGLNLDILARSALWNQGIDYRCGTGHGVGHLLSVHEGPQSIRWKQSQDRGELEKLKPGMVLTDEPGVYADGKFGIRIENQLVVKPAFQNEYGRFLKFEQLTCVPIDLGAVDETLLSSEEKNWLKEYNNTVYERIAPHLCEEEREWLKKETAYDASDKD
ncbi:MAG: aminopeptidase P family protein [Clostridia bacterium]|nr:aminopeptidase P family protein [Clostridia bacterium]